MIYGMLVLALTVCAQKPQQDIKKNLRLSGGSFLAYPGPKQHKLTSAPENKKPFYISHFGRHGSRYPTKTDDFTYVIETLQNSEDAHALTPLGSDVLQRVKMMEQEAYNRAGELTSLGAQQQQEIAERMTRRFPTVFEGNVTIEAKSTTSIRAILSMTNALLRLQALNPKLKIKLDASQADMDYLRHNDKLLNTKSLSDENVAVYNAFVDKHSPWQRAIGQLYADTAYLNHNVDGFKLNKYLFRLASVVQDMDIRKKITLYDLFTDEEIYENWRKDNAFWYLGTALLPLICLMGINGYDLSTNDLDQMERQGWANYKMIPMAGNLQFVFYRNGIHDKDILVKVLLNENEATLPLKTDIAPYYHWEDFRNYYLQRINAYNEECALEEE